MKKRFTIMLEEETIILLKKLATKRSPIGQREDLEKLLYKYAEEELYLEEIKYGK